MDDDSNKRLDMGEFKKGISDYGLVLENEVSTFNSIKNGCLKYRGGGVTSVYVRLSHRIQKGQDIGGHRRT